MFLSIREIRKAGSRFALIGSVTVLITLLIVMLTGLTNGLGKQNTGALESLNPDKIAFVSPSSTSEPEVSFTNSAVSDEALNSWRAVEGVEKAIPLGVSQTRLESEHAAEPGALLALPEGTEFAGGTVGDGAVLSAELARKLQVGTGDVITLGGQEASVVGVVDAPEGAVSNYYSHSPVAWVDTHTWQQAAHTEAVGTVVLLTVDSHAGDLAVPKHSVVTGLKGSFAGLAAYSSEQGSLRSMQGFLYAISALVTISFLTVWTMQRTRDIAVLRAIGASRRYVLIDALTQSAIILGVGSFLGAVLGWAAGWAVQSTGTVPFHSDWQTVAAPAVGVFLLGLIGSLIAVRTVSKVNPLLALGAAQ
ncbi:MAG: FtsX-like permease family protein [Corynebacterium sp.]|uniref:ABC transporter permease n=1 Tax=Corynebacterium sp. TaxID=1720 RepID=UPI0026DBF717|nr:FtsX-like permease family protein [Corynebacterium sp.]MDO4761674.1 FtsX-like permease family protein [Corynebacterium sp.]